MKVNYYVQFNVSEKFKKEPLREQARTLLANKSFCGGQREPKIMEEPIALDEQNKCVRTDGTIGTLTTDGSSPKHNNRVIEPIIYDDYNGRIKADQSAIGTLTTNCGSDAERNGVKIIEPTIWGSLQEHCAVKKNGICPTLTGAMGMGGGQIPVHNYGYRIRKLTPKECFRLMGVKDEDYEKVEKIKAIQVYTTLQEIAL